MKDIAVIGSGPAGMATAYCLAKAGFKITVIEKSTSIGGKVTSYEENGLSFEHGIHGWWNNYNNFTAIIKDCGLKEDDIFKRVYGSNMFLTNGDRHLMKILKFPLPSPLFMLWQTLTAPYLTFKDCLSLIRFGIVLFGFDQKKDYEKYDKLSFQELMDECKVSKTVQELILKPFILSFDFTIPSRVSAACGLSGMHFYVIRDQLSVCTRWLKGTPNKMIFDPMRKVLEDNYGVVFETSNKVERISVDGENKKVSGCVLKSTSNSNDTTQLIATVPIPDIEEGSLEKLQGYNILVGKNEGRYIAFDNTCSHNGCSVSWSRANQMFECPCHGGRYNRDGTVHSGPPPYPLRSLVVEIRNNKLFISSNQRFEERAFDEIILATDVYNARNIMVNSLPLTHTINRNLGRLDTTPVIVVRIWFEGTNYEPEVDSAITPEFTFIDNYFNLNSFSSDYDPQGHLIEVQAYRVFSELDKGDEDILQMALNDLAIINARYKRNAVKSYQINRHKQLFTRYAPRLNASRPKAGSTVRGLYFAGDWTGFDYPVWMMERAVSSGIRAANLICQKYDREQFPYIALGKGGWLFRLTKRVARSLLRFQEFRFRKFWEDFQFFRQDDGLGVVQRKKDVEGFYFSKPTTTGWWDWLVFLLHSAAEIEHSLMVQYLFSGYSINPLFGAPEYEMVSGWKTTVLKIAVEEMGHLLVVQSILNLIGGPLNFEREDYPFRSDLYPFPFELRRFDKQTLAKFIIAEIPGTTLDSELREILKVAKISLNNGQINNVGLLYEDIINIFKDQKKIPDSCFHYDELNTTSYNYWSFVKDLISADIRDRVTVISTLEKVAEQGEGTGAQEDSHYERFLSIYREFDTVDSDRSNEVSVNVQPNPSLNVGAKNQITEERAVLWAELHDIKYRMTLSLLSHLLTIECGDAVYTVKAQKDLLQLIHWEMSGRANQGGLKQVSERLFSLPLSSSNKFGFRAGPCFNLPYTLAMPNSESGRWRYYLRLFNQQEEILTKLLDIESERIDASQCRILIGNMIDTVKGYL